MQSALSNYSLEQNGVSSSNSSVLQGYLPDSFLPYFFNLQGPFFYFLLGVFIFLGILLPWYFRKKNKVKFTRAINLIFFSISVPKEEDQESKQDKKDDKEIISVIEQLLMSFFKMRDTEWRERFFGPPQFALEIANPSNDEAIRFFIGCPKRFATSLEKQIYGFFPKAEVKMEIDGYSIFTPQAIGAGCYLGLKKPTYLPLKTYKHLESDSLNNITTALSKLKKKEEGAVLQFILRPAPSSWRRRGLEISRYMKQGESFAKAKRGELSRFFWSMVKMNMKSGQGKQAYNRYNPDPDYNRQLTPGEEEMLKAIEEKTLKPAFETNIRLLSSAETKERAEEILMHLENSFNQFDTMEMNGFIPKKVGSFRDFIVDYAFRNFSPWHSFILNTEEVASIFHFPLYSTQTPKLEMVRAKTATPPANLPREGLIIGKNTYRGVEVPIFIKEGDRRRHLYTIGQTGTGKSSFLENLARQDIENGNGVCVIDPHGDLVEVLLECIPKERADDLILFDPADVARPLGMNLLEYDRPEQKTFVINEMINIFDKLYDLKQTGGPMFEQYMRNAMLLVMSHPESGSTLMEISKVLADPDFRKMKLDNCDNQIVVDFWVKEAEKAGGEAALVNMVPYITSKLTSFVTNDIMRPIISQQKSAFNFREAMDTGKIVLINLSKGKIGELNAFLLGMVIVGKILMNAMSRVDVPESARRDFYLYIDEFQNVTTSSIASILSEARKYHLNLIIAHQFIHQLDEKIRDAVFGNVGSMAVFRIGPNDSEFMAKQFFPVFSERDLINIKNYNAYVKVMIDGVMSPPFSMETIAPNSNKYNLGEALREYSSVRYGRDREEVEKELKERMKLSERSDFIFSDKPIDSDMPVK